MHNIRKEREGKKWRESIVTNVWKRKEKSNLTRQQLNRRKPSDKTAERSRDDLIKVIFF